MPRPERPLEGQGGPVEELAAGLRALRDKAGTPGYRQMAARANYSVATLSAAASGRRLPTLEVTLAYVAACDGDPQEWERRWREAKRLSVSAVEETGNGRGAPPPYPGLAMFQPADAEVFFGRDELVGELTRRLRARRFLAVFGASGAGKSSVVRAGLVPAMGGPAVVFTPGTHPMAELAVQLGRHAGVPAGGLLDELRADPERAPLIVRQGLHGVPADVDLLVVVDQFEEVFAACPDAAERAGFVAALLAMCREPDGRARVVLTVRADHYARFTEYPRLLAALTDAQVLIGGMSPAELREAVTRPAEVRGARVEGALVATIVAEVADSPGALPLAAHALREAWDRRQGAIVTLAGYRAAGGVAGAVARTAEQAYERLGEPERVAAQRLLLRMVDVGPDGLITRRRLTRAERDTIDRATAVVDAFAAARLVSVDRDTVEIAHEALIRAWPRLCGWVEESRAGLRLHRQLTEAAAAWESLDRDEGALYRGVRLSATADAGVLDLAPAEREFLEASLALRDREARGRQRRTRWLVSALAAGLAVVCVLATGAVVAARQAASERDRAVARELAAASRAERMADPELALLLAQRAYRLHPDPETESVLRQGTADARVMATMSMATQVTSVAISGNQVAGADTDGMVRVWDLQGRTPPLTAPVPGVFVAGGPDGRLAITRFSPASGTTQIVLWRPGENTTRPLEPLVPTGMARLAYSPSGRWVAAIGADSRVHVWDTTRPGWHRTLRYTGFAGGLSFSGAGRLALASDDGTIRVWDVNGSAAPLLIRQPAETSPVSVAFSLDGSRIAVAGFGKVTVWPADGRAGSQTYRGPETWYGKVAFTRDGSRIAAATDERTVRIWDVADTTTGTLLRGHHGTVQDLAFSGDGRRLVTGGSDATVRVWDTSAGADPAPITLASAPGELPRLSDDGAYAATVSRPGTVSVISTGTRLTVATLRHAAPDLRFLAVSRDGRGVAGTVGEQIHWWRAGDGAGPAVRECPRRSQVTTNSAAFSADGTVLAVDCGDGEMMLWRAGNPRVADRISGYGPIAISPDATLVALSQSTNDVVLWDPAAGRAVRTLRSQSMTADHIRFSPDGRLLAAVGEDGAVRVWSVTGDGEPVVLTGAIEHLTAIAFSPDGRLIAGVGTDDVVRVWNTDGTGEALTFDHPTGARQLAFSADGRRLISLSATTVRVTPCEACGSIDEVLSLAHQRTTRDFTPQERAKYLREPG
ncbi:WD40 repeat protein [Actinoplanes octamycinicus]|uniref:WD40 repeat protein n=1 Tax=Actinoplanes octamycinicus TaxID=135948 RepID=A0A7W7H131_9ACTN|nr:hypothetical protein [Actinoplanes octamycinicus]MBB4741899.1 WD40 repeat protein [Actinoplanes octamycinicus]GIE60662.1 hypothetical protein Aoc01nite_60640 [Actinoplanes octamycinicus]